MIIIVFKYFSDAIYCIFVHKFITAPSYKLRTGMIGLNNMLGGGFEKELEEINGLAEKTSKERLLKIIYKPL